MSMKANVLRDANGNIIVHMQGDLNYDHSYPLRVELQQIVKNNPNTKITIDIGAIDFGDGVARGDEHPRRRYRQRERTRLVVPGDDELYAGREVSEHLGEGAVRDASGAEETQRALAGHADADRLSGACAR